ncbi:MAG: mechanosensitive ion channel [Acidobacteriota bacterium]|nr:mechanosensitive ion channel [Acidobacteriota bacterium]
MNEETLAIQQQLVGAFRDMAAAAVRAAPRILVALVLVIVALVVAKLVEMGLRALLKRLRFDSLLERLGLTSTLSRLGLSGSPAASLAKVFYFLLLFLFARIGADALGLTAVSQALGSFLAYVPNLVAACLIFLLGSLAAQLASRAVSRTATESGIEYASSLGGLVYALIFFVAAIMALGQLRIDTEIVRLVTAGILAAGALGFGLSLGLGTRDITRNILAGFYARKVFRIGEEMEIAGERGTLTAITPTQTLLERDDRTIAVANSVYLEDVVKQ